MRTEHVTLAFAMVLAAISFAGVTHRWATSAPPAQDNTRNLLEDRQSLGVWRVSAYCLCDECINVPEFRDGLTASGTPAKGQIVAAPPEMPFGTVLDIRGYGIATVEDRGSAIQGKRLDVLMPTHQAALIWGVKNIEIFQVIP